MPGRSAEKSGRSGVTTNQLSKSEHSAIGRHIYPGRREVVEGAARRLDDVELNKGCAFGRSLLGTLGAAFPFQDRPAVEPVLGQLRECCGNRPARHPTTETVPHD